MGAKSRLCCERQGQRKTFRGICISFGQSNLHLNKVCCCADAFWSSPYFGFPPPALLACWNPRPNFSFNEGSSSRYGLTSLREFSWTFCVVEKCNSLGFASLLLFTESKIFLPPDLKVSSFCLRPPSASS